MNSYGTPDKLAAAPDLRETPCEGERKLWAAVLQQALLGLEMDPKRERFWFFESDDRVGSLTWICSITGTDAGFVRRKARETGWSARKPCRWRDK